MDGDFYNELGATMLLLGARECLLSASDGEHEAIKNLLARNGVIVAVPCKILPT
uniref:Uncharacterized protein n=1 Tax=Glossina morsitans morsitans TaxID=37546 RepID=A0ABK9NG47_GLOMM